MEPIQSVASAAARRFFGTLGYPLDSGSFRRLGITLYLPVEMEQLRYLHFGLPRRLHCRRAWRPIKWVFIQAFAKACPAHCTVHLTLQ